MKYSFLPLAAVAFLFASCDARVNVPPSESNTTIVNPPAAKTESNTTIVNPPAATTEKTTSTTTTTN